MKYLEGVTELKILLAGIAALAACCSVSYASAADYDSDDDGLIEIGNLHQLNAVRWDLDGDGTPLSWVAESYAAAFPGAAANMGCPASGSCRGYELLRDLDFADLDSYAAGTTNTVWASGAGWSPIGVNIRRLKTEFNGNGHTIYNLRIDSLASHQGLFGVGGQNAMIANVGVTGKVASRSNGSNSDNIGGLVGQVSNSSTVANSYSTVTAEGSHGVASLVGRLETGAVRSSYATGSAYAINAAGGLIGAAGSTLGSATAEHVYATGYVGTTSDHPSAFASGLVADVSHSSRLRHGYATAAVAPNMSARGGVIGRITGSDSVFAAVYWDTQTSGATNAVGNGAADGVIGKTTAELRLPTTYTGIYGAWNADANDHWDFGDSEQYPALKVDFNNDGMATWQEFGCQLRAGVAAATQGADQRRDISWGMPDTAHCASSPTVAFAVYRDGSVLSDGKNLTAMRYADTAAIAGTNYVYHVAVVIDGGEAIRARVVSRSHDYDRDDDGLIEIANLEQLNALRWDTDGDGAPTSDHAGDYARAFPHAIAGMGCADGCSGYELTTALDFRAAASYAGGAVNEAWTAGDGWSPIGDSGDRFTATFNGDGYAIEGLHIGRLANQQGLFGELGEGAMISNVGVTGAITATPYQELMGGLVAAMVGGGRIEKSYSTVSVAAGFDVGSLLGYNEQGAVRASYATGNVSGHQEIGGLIGQVYGVSTGSTVEHTYATGQISLASGGFNYNVGGLIGNLGAVRLGYGYATAQLPAGVLRSGGVGGGVINANAILRDAYWDIDTSGIANSASGSAAVAGISGETTAGLQAATGYVGIYQNWNADGGDYWDFGSASQYPALKVDFDNDDIASWQEFGYQLRDGPANLTASGADTDWTLEWSAPDVSHWSPATPTVTYAVYHNGALLSDGIDFAQTRYAITGADLAVRNAYWVAAVIHGGEASRSDRVVLPINDYDSDDDGLIEISTLEQLDAVRFDLDGDGIASAGARAYGKAFVGALVGMGCPAVASTSAEPSGCRGYELDQSLDFDDPDSYATGKVHDAWREGEGWEPIGGSGADNRFVAAFAGNGHTIYNLHIDRDASLQGLFGVVETPAVISRLGVTGAVNGQDTSGGLAGQVRVDGVIEDSFSTVAVSGRNEVGSLVGRLRAGTVRTSYATGNINSHRQTGGLIGRISTHGGTVEHVYATGYVSGLDSNSRLLGGLIGRVEAGQIGYGYSTALIDPIVSMGSGVIGENVNATFTDVYWDRETSANSNGVGDGSDDGISGWTSAELQLPTTYTGIYASWNASDGDHWDFGTSEQYPALKIDFDGNGEASWQEFGCQLRTGPTLTVSGVHATRTLTWDMPDTSHCAPAPMVTFALYRDGILVPEIENTALTEYADTNTTATRNYVYHVAANVYGGEAIRSAIVSESYDYDRDDNGLIEVSTLEQFNAMRWDLDGNGVVAAGDQTDYDRAFHSAISGLGCVNDACIGYELTRDLNFAAADSYHSGRINTAWTSGAGWPPIGGDSAAFTATFDGNGHTLRRLRIDRNAPYQGLFGAIAGAVVRNVGVTGSIDAGDNNYVGGLIGDSASGTIEDSYSAVAVEGRAYVGSLLGASRAGAAIRRSYATGNVFANSEAGGLLGRDDSGSANGTIEHTYASGYVNVTRGGSSQFGGGLIGNLGNANVKYSYATGLLHPSGSASGGVGGVFAASVEATAVYWDTETSAKNDAIGLGAVTGIGGKGTAELQSPTDYAGIYANWNDGGDHWDFGSAAQYPALKVDFDGNGEARWQEFGYQLRQGPPALSVAYGDTARSLNWQAPTAAPEWDAAPPIRYRVYRDGIALAGAYNLSAESYADMTANTTSSYAYHVAAVIDGGEASRSYAMSGRDYDFDDDGLIDIANLDQLNAMRWDLDGDGIATAGNRANYQAAFLIATEGMGCPKSGCIGYELLTNLDFSDPADHVLSSTDTWMSGEGWPPIGDSGNPFATTFNGNGHAIENLHIRRNAGRQGLFGSVGEDGVISNIGVSGTIRTDRHQERAGGLVAELHGGLIEESYSTVALDSAFEVGSLLGFNDKGTVRASYATGYVRGHRGVGGLIGEAYAYSNESTVEHTYATGQLAVAVSDADNDAGGLIGYLGAVRLRYSYSTARVPAEAKRSGAIGGGASAGAPVFDSVYWDVDASGELDKAVSGGYAPGVAGAPTVLLQAFADYEDLYASWNAENTDYWDFGADKQYPALQVDFNNDGDISWQEFGYQLREGPTLTMSGIGASRTLSWTTPDTSHWPASAPIIAYVVYHNDAVAADGLARTSYVDAAIDLDIINTYRVAAVVGGGEASRSAGFVLPIRDYDRDDDGLIEIATLEQLDAVRWDLDSEGPPMFEPQRYQRAFIAALPGMGCPAAVSTATSACRGYELIKDLDFADPASYASGAINAAWTEGDGWPPIGEKFVGNRFETTFDGNGHTIHNLYGGGTPSLRGLFGGIEAPAIVRRVGVTGSIRVQDAAGGLVGRIYDGGTVEESYSAVAVRGTHGVGSLVGDIQGGIVRRSYATGNATGSSQIGGLIGGIASEGASVEHVYATGYADGTRGGANSSVGGLIGRVRAGQIRSAYSTALVYPAKTFHGGFVGRSDAATFDDVYWDVETSAMSNGVGNGSDSGIGGKTSMELQMATTYAGIYANWNADGGDYWDFGGAKQYPALKIDFNNSGEASWQEFGYQLREGPSRLETGSGAPRKLAWQAPDTSHWDPAPAVGYAVYRDGVALTRDDDIRDTAYMDSGAIDGVDYVYQVAAVVHGGEASRSVAVSRSTDYDTDDNGLIEISSLDQLNVVRWDLDGDGVPAASTRAYLLVFPDAALPGMGCPAGSGCRGYELNGDLDFADVGSYVEGSTVTTAWTQGEGWEPIGGSGADNKFTAVFNGNGHTIYNLHIDRDAAAQGLFGIVETPAVISRLGVTGVVRVREVSGGLAGQLRTDGVIEDSFSTVAVRGRFDIGSLVGRLRAGTIRRSYATGNAEGFNRTGGLIGRISAHGGTVEHVYATGYVSGFNRNSESSGGLLGNAGAGQINYGYSTALLDSIASMSGGFVGENVNATFTDVYWDRETSAKNNGVGDGSDDGISGWTSAELQMPTTYTGIYENWNTSDSDHWDFGTSEQYPALKTDFDGYGEASWQEFGCQLREGPADLTVGYQLTSRTLDWSEPELSHWASTPTITYAVYRDGIVLADGIETSSYADVTADADTIYAYHVAAVINGGEASRSVIVSGRDYDIDDDGLIGIGTLEQLNAMRWDMDGDGNPDDADHAADYAAAFPNTVGTVGCPGVCGGYELTRDLDFDNPADYASGAVNSAWADGWDPIGNLTNVFATAFNGNGHTVYNLGIDTNAERQGLFGDARGATIANIGVTGAIARAGNRVGGVVGSLEGGAIANSYSAVSVRANGFAGGIVGYVANIALRTSYATGNVSASNQVGGLLGFVSNASTSLEHAYATGRVDINGDNANRKGGGLIGDAGGARIGYAYATALVVPDLPRSGGAVGVAGSDSVFASVYWDLETSGRDNAADRAIDGIDGKSSAELRSPPGYVGIYADWNTDGGDYWDFGSSKQYPALKIDFNNDGEASWQEFGCQVREKPILAARGTGDVRTLAWSAPDVSHCKANTSVSYNVYRDGEALTAAGEWTATSYVDAQRSADTEYVYHLAAVIDGGEAARQSIRSRIVDYDDDDDGLIEIDSLEQLDAVRWDLGGDGVPATDSSATYAAVFPDPADDMGCPGGCSGYELMRNLDFDDFASYVTGNVSSAWTTGEGWAPIGAPAAGDRFAATFDGNGHTIYNLHIDRDATAQGLFGAIETPARIGNLGVTGAVVGNDVVGGLVGLLRTDSAIENSYSAVAVRGRSEVGSLAGRVRAAAVRRSYATGNAAAANRAGGLIGRIAALGGTAEHAYATGYVSGVNNSGEVLGGLIGDTSAGQISYAYSTALIDSAATMAGGVVGENSHAAFADIYWDRETSGKQNGVGAGSDSGIDGKTSFELRMPTTYTGIYKNWNTDNSDYWDFGASDQYPALKVDFDGDGAASWREFGCQARSAPVVTASGAGTSRTLNWSAPDTDHCALPQAVTYAVYRDGAALTAGEGIAETTYADTAAVIDDTYAYHVAAVVHGGEAVRGVAVSMARDYDSDDDGLIEVATAEQLAAIRWDLDGDGAPSASTQEYVTRFVDAATNMGCVGTCAGYELINDLDLRAASAGSAEGWVAIGSEAAPFTAIFNGNGNVIANLSIDREADRQGLFGAVVGGTVRNVGVTGTVDASASSLSASGDRVGGLIGELSDGAVRDSYSAVTALGDRSIGSLLGSAKRSVIRASYATGNTHANGRAGGLIGRADDSGGGNDSEIAHVYATGFVDATMATFNRWAGGLIGSLQSAQLKYGYSAALIHPDPIESGGLIGFNALRSDALTAVYWDAGASGRDNPIGLHVLGPGYEGGDKSISELQAPTTYAGIYANWNADGADYWDFGSNNQYPALKVDFNNDGEASWREFGCQLREPPQNAVHYLVGAAVKLTWDAPDVSHCATPPTVGYAVYRDGIRLTAPGGIAEARYLDETSVGGIAHTYHIAAVVNGGEASRHVETLATIDYDRDDDNLLDISNLDQLNAIRWDTDGDGHASTENRSHYLIAFPKSSGGKGCPSGCGGYELTRDLDFADANSYAPDSDSAKRSTGAGWLPIGAREDRYAAVFDGKGRRIDNLRIDRAADRQGLFGSINSSATVSNIGITGSVAGGDQSGGLVGELSGGIVTNSYSAVSARGGEAVAPLVGYADGGAVLASYASGNTSATAVAGGLIGGSGNSANTTVEYVYATGYVNAQRAAGGLIGNMGALQIKYSYAASLINSAAATSGGIAGEVNGVNPTFAVVYWDAQVTGKQRAAGSGSASGATGKTGAELQTPTAYSGIYADWNADDSDNWDFGNAEQYPALKADFDGDGIPSWQEFGCQIREDLALTVRGVGDRDLSWSAPDTTHCAADTVVAYAVYRDSLALASVAEARAEYADTTAAIGSDYTYHVVAVIDGGEAARSVAVSRSRDYDTDDNGLIEITNLEQLDALRWDLDGDGIPSADSRRYETAFPHSAADLNCAHGCNGYELTRSLDFNDSGSYAASTNSEWTAGAGWMPIGARENRFIAAFNGNGHVIENLYIRRDADAQGLFGSAAGATITGVGVTGSVRGGTAVGGLVGELAGGTVAQSYSTVAAQGTEQVGSLLGSVNGGVLRASYATGRALADAAGGGLSGGGDNDANIIIEHVYAAGYVNAQRQGGGLLGSVGGNMRLEYAYSTALVAPGNHGGVAGRVAGGNPVFEAVYWDSDVSGQSVAFGFGSAAGVAAKTAAELQSPTGHVGIYAKWDVNGSIDYWDFGAADEYPALKTDFDGEGTPSWQEFGYQLRQGPRDAAITYADHANVLTWSAPDTSHWQSPPAIAYAVYRDGIAITTATAVMTYEDTERVAGTLHAYSVAAIVHGGEASRSAAPVGLAIADTDPAANTIAENATVGAPLRGITLIANDGDSAVTSGLTWILSDDAGGLFAIDRDSGEITLARAELDHETTPTYVLQVRAERDGDLSAPFAVRADVGNVPKRLTVTNAAMPDITIGAVPDSRIAKNTLVGAPVSNIMLVVSDETNNPVTSGLTWSLPDDADGLFAIDSASGEIVLARSVEDHENTQTHTVRVRVETDNMVYAELEVAIAIDNAPESLTIANRSTATIAVAENTPVGALLGGITLVATDETNNPVTSGLTWSLTEDADGLFAIDADSGAIRLAGMLDYETSATHTITAQAAEGAVLSNRLDLMITVIDFDEAIIAPTVSDTDPTTNTIVENSADTAVAGVSLAATRNGVALSGIIWQLTDDASGLFVITTAGVVRTSADRAPDYETDAGHRVRAAATASDGSIGEYTLMINVTNVLESLRVADDNSADNRIAENAATATAVSGIALVARDEANNPVTSGLTWSLSDNAGGLFAIDSASGEIRLAAAAALGPVATTHTVAVRVSFAGAEAVESDDWELTIEVTEPRAGIRLRLRLFLEGPLR